MAGLVKGLVKEDIHIIHLAPKGFDYDETVFHVGFVGYGFGIASHENGITEVEDLIKGKWFGFFLGFHRFGFG